MATGTELDKLIQYHNKENQDEKLNCTTATESSMRQMPMTTEMTTLHRTSPLAWHCTLSTLTSTSTESGHYERAQSCFLVHISSHSHFGSSSSLVENTIPPIQQNLHEKYLRETNGYGVRAMNIQ